MKKPNLHPQEEERLRELENLKILDSIDEIEYDNITLIASQICKTPVALISLIDGQRQWFKSKVGLKAIETPRDFAFCAHAILQDEVFVINDSTQDPRFYDNPLVRGDPHVVFYAGAPLLSPETHLPIGTLCVIDHKSRSLDEDQLKSLKALSHQITQLLRLRKQVNHLKTMNDQLTFYKVTFESMSEGMVMQDLNGAIIDFNPAALEVLSLSAEQLQGKTSLDSSWKCIKNNGEDFPGEEHPAMIALKTGQSQRGVVMGVQITQENIKWISINATPLFMTESRVPTHVIATFADITEARSAQQTLIQSAKMSSLGEMAGGIAHEINTPLAIICGAAEQGKKLAQQSPIQIEKLIRKINQIEETGHRIAKIVKGLRAFSRESEADELTESSVIQIINDAISLCGERMKNHGINLICDLKVDFYVSCVPIQMTQVILNLLNNSLDAIDTMEEKWIRIDLLELDQNIQIQVTDSGCGISEDLQHKIMQPFFTTKEIGKGTGLGLSISKSIVEKFGGKLLYQLNKGHTSFVIKFIAPHLVSSHIL